MDIHENFDPPVGDDDEPTIDQIHDLQDQVSSVQKLIQINKAMDDELEQWDKAKLNLGNFGVHTINLDNQIWGLVEYLKVLIPNFDETEFEYRWRARMVLKINELRHDVVRQQTAQEITAGIIGPDGAPIQIPKNGG